MEPGLSAIPRPLRPLLAAEIPTAVPATFAAGDTVKFTQRFADYPASAGWVLTVYLRGASVLNGTVVTDPNDADGFLVTLSAAATAALAAGTYRYAARVALDGEAFTVGEGVVTVTPDVSAALAGALQTFEEKQLATVESEITARLTGTGGAHNGYTIGDRAIEKIPLTELYAIRGVLRAQVSAQRGNGRLPSRVVVFRSASDGGSC